MRPLLIPQRLDLNALQRDGYEQHHALLAEIGFELTQISPGQVLVRAIPVWLQGFDSQHLLLVLLERHMDRNTMFATIEQSLLLQSFDLGSIDFKHFLHLFTPRREELTPCWREVTQADLLTWLGEQPTRHE